MLWKLFKGGNYSRMETIRGDTVILYLSLENLTTHITIDKKDANQTPIGTQFGERGERLRSARTRSARPGSAATKPILETHFKKQENFEDPDIFEKPPKIKDQKISDNDQKIAEYDRKIAEMGDFYGNKKEDGEISKPTEDEIEAEKHIINDDANDAEDSSDDKDDIW